MTNNGSPEIKVTVVNDGTYEARHRTHHAVIAGEIAEIRWRCGVKNPEQAHQETRDLAETKDHRACRVTLNSRHADAWEVHAEFGDTSRRYHRDETTAGIMMSSSADGASLPAQPLGPDPEGLHNLLQLQKLLFDFNNAGTS